MPRKNTNNLTLGILVVLLLIVVVVGVGRIGMREHITTGGCTSSPIQRGFTRRGNDLQFLQNIPTSEECADRCCAKDGCESYVHFDTGHCYLKRGQVTPVDSGNPRMGTGTITRISTGTTAGATTGAGAPLNKSGSLGVNFLALASINKSLLLV